MESTQMEQTAFWETSWKTLDPGRVFSYVERFDFSEDAILRCLRQRGVQRVCDAGCGCGVYALKLAMHGFAVAGFDLSEHAVEFTRRLLEGKGYPSQDFRAANVLETGYADGVFDAVVCRDVLDHMPLQKAVAAVRELLRIVRPGGVLLLTLDQTDEEYEAQPHTVNADGDYLFSAGKWKGMVFHPYSPETCSELTGGYSAECLPLEDGCGIILEKQLRS